MRASISFLLGAALLAFGLGVAVGHQWHQRIAHTAPK